ncbi:MAG: hypothetical protein HKN80_02875 [Acidimicrobiia bacterium]|nr:hypothetical protein [Acidimicrobiia bacterium]
MTEATGIAPAATVIGAMVVVVVVVARVVVEAGARVVGGAVVGATLAVEVVVGTGIPVAAVSPVLQAAATKARTVKTNRIRIASLPCLWLRLPHHRPTPSAGLEQ